VPDLYKQPCDPLRAQVCHDEWRRALIAEIRTRLPAELGKRKRIDYEYQCDGLAYLHMWFEPSVDKRRIRVTGQLTMKVFHPLHAVVVG
jgi:hypothetical protein